MKRVLMICYAFPPSGAAGARRPLYFAKYLPSFGYYPIVVHGTPSPRGGVVDRFLLREVPAEVTRLECRGLEPAVFSEPVARWALRLGRIGRGLSRAVRAATEAFDKVLSPDPLVFWGRRLVERLVRLVGKLRVEAVYSTSPPCTDHYLAWMLKRRTGLPWIADFRDLWTQNCSYVAKPKCRADRDRLFERRFLREADAVVSVSPFYAETLHGQASCRPREVFHVITNGFEPSVVPRRPFAPNAQFCITYTGALYRQRWSDAFVRTLQRINREFGSENGVHFHLIGRVAQDCLRSCEALGPNFTFYGHISQDRAVAATVESDALLLTVDRGRNIEGTVPGKLFEYLATGRPVLCLTPVRGDAARIVEETNGGIVADIDSEDEIYRAITRLHSARKSGSPIRGASPEAMARYERRPLTGQLAAILDGLTAQGEVRVRGGSVGTASGS